MMPFSLSKWIASTAIATILVAMSAVSFAEKMDVETHSLLIEKLERVVSQGDTNDVSVVEVRLRLADLLAERARLHLLAAEGQDSPAAKKDRKRSLHHYTSIFEKVDNDRRAKVMMQMAHLNESLGDTAKANALFERIVSEGPQVHLPAAVGQAQAGIGDLLYRKGEFAKALVKFKSSLQLSSSDRKGWITYRIAWCHLNLGLTEVATQNLIMILRTPEFITHRTSTGETEVDTTFQEDVAQDLVSFLARGNLTIDKIHMLMELTPERLRPESLRSLAKETERLGKKKNAITVWTLILEDSKDAVEIIEGHVHLAILEWGLDHKADAVEQLAKATQVWQKQGCKDKDECLSIQNRFRKLVVDWNRLEKERVSLELLQAYNVYNTQFDEQYDMHFWAAQTARILKRYNEASELYRRASILAHRELAAKQDKGVREMFEAALIAQIEMAESGGDLAIREKAYNHYLELNPKGERALEVRYQRARVWYDQNHADRATGEFREVALTDDKGQIKLRKKAADLSLDALVLAKQEGRIETWALEFAKAFPQARVEYLNIARRAVLKEVAAVSNDTKSSNSELKQAARRLREVNLEGTSAEERRLIFKNHLVLAVRTQDLEETDRAADRLLALKGVSYTDRELALEKKVWAAEMRLEFDQAFRLTKKMEMNKTRIEDRELRLAYLAELAGRNPRPHYENVLGSPVSRSKKILAATRLVRLSNHPWRELKRHESTLRSDRDLFANLVLELYAKSRNKHEVRAYLDSPSFPRHAAGRAIARSFELPTFNKFDKKIAQHRLLTASDALVKRTLTQRLALLKEADQIATKAIQTQDFILQAIALSIVERENLRLYKEVLNLPAPSKLKPDQKKQYQQALTAQATPFQRKASEVDKKLSEFWANSAVIEDLRQQVQNSSGSVTHLLAEQYRDLGKHAPSSVRSRLESAIADANNRPSAGQVADARRALQRDPFSAHQAAKLKDMEAELGRDAMVTYLDARLIQLRGDYK